MAGKKQKKEDLEKLAKVAHCMDNFVRSENEAYLVEMKRLDGEIRTLRRRLRLRSGIIAMNETRLADQQAILHNQAGMLVAHERFLRELYQMPELRPAIRARLDEFMLDIETDEEVVDTEVSETESEDLLEVARVLTYD